MKIMIATFGQETNTFSPDRITAAQFLPNGWIKAEGIVEGFSETGSYLGGAMQVNVRETGVDFYCAGAKKWLGNPFGTGGIRISMHYYNTIEQIDCLVDAIHAFMKEENIKVG